MSANSPQGGQHAAAIRDGIRFNLYAAPRWRMEGGQHAAAIRDGIRFNLYAAPRRRMEEIWALCLGKPLKFPTRRRRQDPEIPKAA